MIRRPPRSTQSRSSAASDVYKRQDYTRRGFVALRLIKADLHVHTCLSPCSGLDMSPREVVNAALQKGLDLIGICDHNSAENVRAVKNAGVRNGLMVLGG